MVAITGQVAVGVHRHGRLPGGRHPRHHDADHQAQLPRHRPGDDPAGDRRGVPHRLHRAPGPGAGRHQPRTRCRPAPPSSGRRRSTCPATARSTRPHAKQIREAARLIGEARRPVLYVGGGVIRSGASDLLRRFAELTGIPVVTTLMARGALPDSHPQHLGMPGMHGTVAGGHRAAEVRPAGHPRRPVRRPRHRPAVHLRPRGQGHPRRHRPGRDQQEPHRGRADRGRLQGGAHRPHRRRAAASTEAGRAGDYAAWREQVLDWKRTFPLGYAASEADSVAPQHVIERIGAISGPEAIFAAGVGQHQMWAAQFISTSAPTAGSTPAGGHDGLRGAGGHGRQGRPSRAAPSGRSTATAASR